MIYTVPQIPLPAKIKKSHPPHKNKLFPHLPIPSTQTKLHTHTTTKPPHTSHTKIRPSVQKKIHSEQLIFFADFVDPIIFAGLIFAGFLCRN